MRNLIYCIITCSMLAAGIAVADTYHEVWQCEAAEGKTIEDAQALNTKWLKWMRENVNEDIDSAVLTAVVGNMLSFLYVDVYPSLEVWAAGKSAQSATDELDELNADFEEAMECADTRLWRRQPTP